MKKWATLHMKDLKTQRTVDMEILMQILCTHMTLANSSLQEAIIKVGSLAESGLRRFFSAWPKVPVVVHGTSPREMWTSLQSAHLLSAGGADMIHIHMRIFTGILQCWSSPSATPPEQLLIAPHCPV
mmetsp:Transcript_9293/g.20356  ORF Transcript_9293/g.20356 Transcript_9293/m.20356 type:complete len:127 (+) Transcript_9293:290-670(+)